MRSARKPDKIIAIDWSGRVDAAGQRRHIVAAIISHDKATRDGVSIESGRTREEWVAWLIAEAKKTPRMVVSLDCCFSYPAWFLAELGCKTVFDFWEFVAAGHGERWLAQENVPRETLFWGKPHKKPAEFCGSGMPRMMRLSDMENKIVAGMSAARAAKVRGIAPKSPFQIGGAGSTGTGSLRAIPFLLQLHRAGFRIWPFESAALDNKKPQPLVIEMYARLLTGAVKKSSAEARRTYLRAKMRDDKFYAKLQRGIIAKAVASEDAFDALISAMEMARHAKEFAKLKKTGNAVRKLEGITWVPSL